MLENFYTLYKGFIDDRMNADKDYNEKVKYNLDHYSANEAVRRITAMQSELKENERNAVAMMKDEAVGFVDIMQKVEDIKALPFPETVKVTIDIFAELGTLEDNAPALIRSCGNRYLALKYLESKLDPATKFSALITNQVYRNYKDISVRYETLRDLFGRVFVERSFRFDPDKYVLFNPYQVIDHYSDYTLYRTDYIENFVKVVNEFIDFFGSEYESGKTPKTVTKITK